MGHTVSLLILNIVFEKNEELVRNGLVRRMPQVLAGPRNLR